jgi:ribosomal-protein-alanine N-acetyltransferase
MTPAQLSQLHADAFQQVRPWSTAEFTDLLSHPSTYLFAHTQAFALVRVIADEAELLTIAVHPNTQGQGIGRALMCDWMQGIAASEAFLEVAQDNIVAISLYKSCGFAEVGRRKGYYGRKDAPNVNAIVMRHAFT